jgi:hypothetical protein
MGTTPHSKTVAHLRNVSAVNLGTGFKVAGYPVLSINSDALVLRGFAVVVAQ